MKTEIRTILRDIQAAARIGHTESIWAALEGLSSLPQVAGNHPMNENFLRQVILPVGRAVAGARQKSALSPLTTHGSAAIRAVAAAALTEQYLNRTNGATLRDLNSLAQDPRKDVRTAILLTISEASLPPDPAIQDRINALYTGWQDSSSPRVQSLAYQMLPSLPPEEMLARLSEISPSQVNLNSEVTKALASILSLLAARDHTQAVLNLLQSWAADPKPEIGLICRTLSSPWAVRHAAAVLQVLETIAAVAGSKKRLRKALLNLYQSGAEREVTETLAAWRSSDDPNLRSAGEDAHQLILTKENSHDTNQDQ
jgi:hypothetical protein